MPGTGSNRDGGARRNRTVTALVAIVSVLGILWAMRIMAEVTLPLAIAFFLAVAVLPVANWVEQRVPSWLGWLGNLAATAVILAFLSLFLFGVAIAARQVTSSGAELFPRLQEALSNSVLARIPGVDGVGELLAWAEESAKGILAGLGGTLGALVLIFFLMLLMLAESADWRAKVGAIARPTRGKEIAEIARAAGARFRLYFVSRLFLGAITGALYAGWLALFGVPLLLVWALLALLLNFIPTIGSLIAGALPFLFVLAQGDVENALLVGGGLLVIEQVMGNFIDPKVTGRQLSLSPLVILMSLLLWSWVWGLPGALIATPMTMLLTIAFAHVDTLRPFALLMSQERDFDGLDKAIGRNGKDG